VDQPLFDDARLPPDLDARVRAELRPGERLLWVGQPRRRRFPREALPAFLFGIPFTAFAVFWTALAVWIVSRGHGANDPGLLFRIVFPLFGLPFVLIGVGLLSTPYWLRRQATRTCYALTDRRAILWEAGTFGGVAVRSFAPDALTGFHRVEYPDGHGDLVFEEVHTEGRDRRGRRRIRTARHGFLDVEEVRRIEELLRKALLQSGP
jgi:hypothetical protein